VVGPCSWSNAATDRGLVSAARRAFPFVVDEQKGMPLRVDAVAAERKDLEYPAQYQV